MTAEAHADRVAERPMREVFEEFRAHHLMFERHLTAEERSANLAPELIDAILRIEGMFDPTRVGAFGPALRMSVRPGTASMTNVFGDQWRRADADPNLHYRVRYLAQAWLDPAARDCADYSRFRPDDSAIVLDRPTPADCARLSNGTGDRAAATGQAAISAAPTSLPIFAAPYPGNRFSPADLHAVMGARLRAIQAQVWFSARHR